MAVMSRRVALLIVLTKGVYVRDREREGERERERE
jgi:hypothetical protein